MSVNMDAGLAALGEAIRLEASRVPWPSKRGPAIRNVRIPAWPDTGNDAADEAAAQVLLASGYLGLLRKMQDAYRAQGEIDAAELSRVLLELGQDEEAIRRWYGVGTCGECGLIGEGTLCLMCEEAGR